MNEASESTAPVRHHRSRPISALIFIALGILLLFNNFGWLPWSTWDVVWHFWPALLIVWGLQMMLGRHMLSQFIVTLVTIGIMLFILFYVIATSSSPANNWFRQHYPNAPAPTYISPQNNWN